MKMNNYHIIPYTEEFLPEVAALEKGILQGRNIKLELVKEHFLDRAKVFKKFYPCIALSNEKQVIGLAVGAQTKLIINDTSFDVGIGFDTKINPAWRNNGVGRKLAKNIYKQFFIPKGLNKNFMTAKKSNLPVLKLISSFKDIWVYDFVYLSIPVSARIFPHTNTSETDQKFTVQLFNKEEVPAIYYTQCANGLGYFHTHKMYRLRIKKISRLYQFGIGVLKKLKPSKYKTLPRKNDLLSVATLYSHNAENLAGINEVLEQLEKTGIGQLLVCCQKNDTIYKFLKKFSINEYGYYIISDFKLEKNDHVTIDVRCL